MILSISLVLSGLQSVKSETSRGTLSMVSRCGRMFSMPLGSWARFDRSKSNGSESEVTEAWRLSEVRH